MVRRRRRAAAHTVLRGLAGLVAAGAESGPSREDADSWVQARPPPTRDRPAVDRRRRAGARAPPVGPAVPRGSRRRRAERLVELPDGELLRRARPGRRPRARRAGRLAPARGDHVRRRHVAIRDEASRNGIYVNERARSTPSATGSHRPGDRRPAHRRAASRALAPAHAVRRTPPAAPLRSGPHARFAGFLLDEFGADGVRDFLARVRPRPPGPRRASRSSTAPLGALEEAWHNRQRQHAAGGAQVRAFAAQIVPLLRPHRGAHRRAHRADAAGDRQHARAAARLPLLRRRHPPRRERQRARRLHARPVGALLPRSARCIALRGTYAASRLSERIGVELQERMFVHMQRMSHGFFTPDPRRRPALALHARPDVVQQALVTLISGGVALDHQRRRGVRHARDPQRLHRDPRRQRAAAVRDRAHACSTRASARLSYERQAAGGRATAVLQEATAAHDLIKAYGGEDRALAAYRVRLDRMLVTAYRLVMTGAGLQASVGMMAAHRPDRGPLPRRLPRHQGPPERWARCWPPSASPRRCCSRSTSSARRRRTRRPRRAR